MADSIQAAVQDEIIAALAAYLPADMPFFNSQKAQRVNWRVMVERAQRNLSGGLSAPWGVIWFGPLSPVEYGMNSECSRMEVQVWFVDELRDGSATVIQTSTANKTMADRLHDIWHEFRDGTFNAFWVPNETPRVDISESTEANKFFLGSNLPFKASQISFYVEFGEAGI